MTATLAGHYDALARYNRLANERLYAACARLDDAQRRQTRAAFFGSIHGTLNHILLGDRIWMARLEGQRLDTGPLDTILYERFDALEAARREEDAHIQRFMAGLADADWTRTIAYRNHEGLPYADPLPVVLAHLFNHQTHHRGQVHDMLSQTDVPPPSLDLHRLLCPDPVAE